MKRRKTAFGAAALLAVALLVSACGGQTNPASTGSQTGGQAAPKNEEAQKVLRVGTTARSIPFSFKNEETQKLDGFEIEFVGMIADKLGYKVEWTVTDFSGLMGMLEADKVDTIANQVVATEDRKKKYLFSEAYLHSGSRLVVRQDDKSIASLTDLKGKKIAAGLGSNNEVFLQEYEKQHKIGMNIVAYEDTSGVLYDVANGRVDSYLLDQGAGQIRIEKSGLQLQFSGEPVNIHEIAYIFADKDKTKPLIEQFDKAIREFHQDGTLSKLSMKWLKQDLTKK